MVASRQTEKKGIKLALSNHPKFSQPYASEYPTKITKTALEDESTFKNAIKQLRDAVK